MHRTAVRCSARVAHAEKRFFSPLDELDRAFLSLAQAGCPVSLPADVVVGEDGVGDVLSVDRVRAALAHPATEPAARTRIWREVVARAQRDGEPWGTVAAGLAVPVMRRMLCRLPRGGAVDRAEVEQEMLTAFLEAVRSVDVAEPELDRALLGAADRAGHRHVYAACRYARATARPVDHDAGEPPARDGQVSGPEAGGEHGHEYAVLVDAVRAGVITCLEAQVIGRSRLGGESMTALALERRMSRRHFYRYRADAEQRLGAFLREASA